MVPEKVAESGDSGAPAYMWRSDDEKVLSRARGEDRRWTGSGVASTRGCACLDC
jgi:hypothetical protein